MPSLNALAEFKASFQNLGNEPKTLAELRMPFDDLTLPDHEPEIIESQPPSAEGETAPATDETPAGTGEDFSDYLNEPPSEPTIGPSLDSTTDTGFLDMDDILNTVDDRQSENVEDDDINDILPDDFITEETPPEEIDHSQDFETEGLQDQDLQTQDSAVPEGDDFSLPSDVLDNFAQELETGDSSPVADDSSLEDVADDTFGGDISDTNLSDQGTDDFTGFDLGDVSVPEPAEEETPVSTEAEAAVTADDTPFDISIPDDFATSEDTGTSGDESGLDSDDMGNLDDSVVDFDDMGLSTGEPEDTAAPDIGDDFNLGDFPEFPEESEETPTFDDNATLPDDLSLDLDESVDTGEIEAAFEESNRAEPSIDIPMPEEPLDLDDDTAGETTLTEALPVDEDSFDIPDNGIEASLEEVSGDSFDTFSLDPGVVAGEDFGGGFDDSLDRLEDIPIPGLDEVDEEAISGIPGKAETEEVEEINLSTEELEKLLTTLSSYPLNLRVACEESIAEQMVAPAQMSKLIRLLINGAPVEETAALASKILDRHISVPKGYEKSSGEALEAEQASFAYIFVHNFLPVLWRFMFIAGVLFCLGYLAWEYIYTPIRAEQIYKLGLERIGDGEYTRANERFLEAYNIRPKKQWFYTYARAFKEARQYTLADEKYRELLYFTANRNKQHIPEKAAVLEYAEMKTKDIGDYEAADSILRRNILEYNPWDRDALLAVANNSLEWGDYEPERYEDAREAFAKLMERYGRTDPLMEGMLKYFIRTDNLGYVLNTKDYFADTRRKITADTLAEMSGYLLDKIVEEVRGVPSVYLDYIKDNSTLVEIRQNLLRAINENEFLPESYYHLARYYNYLDNFSDEAYTLEVALQAFDYAKEENTRRIGYNIKALQRYAEIQIGRKEFFPAEETIIKGVNLYQNALIRRLIKPAPEYGKLYTSLGDLEFFVKDGDMRTALDYYSLSEQNGWAPPEIQYRMGAAHYQLREWGSALERFYAAYHDTLPNRRILYALGNVSYMRGNYFAAQGYYDRLLDILESDRARLPPISPTNNEEQLDLAERLMITQNNLGVTLEALSERTGDNSYRSRALGLYSDSERAWDILTRNPTTMTRMRPSPDISAPGVNPAYLNVQNSLRPVSDYEPQIFLRIDKDMLEPSPWETLTPPGYSLSEGIYTGR